MKPLLPNKPRGDHTRRRPQPPLAHYLPAEIFTTLAINRCEIGRPG